MLSAIKMIRYKIFSIVGKMNPIKYAKKLGVEIGDDCRLINNPNWGSEPYLITIGNHTLISNDVMFITHDGSTFVFRDSDKFKDTYKFGCIIVGNNCFIGARSTILPGVKIGDNSIVGAGSVVTKNIPDGEVWAGVPAKKITTTLSYAQKCFDSRLPYNATELKKNPRKEMTRVLKK